MSDIEARLSYIEDRIGISDLACNYVHGMDKGDKDRFMDCWTDDSAFVIGGAWGEYIGKENIAD